MNRVEKPVSIDIDRNDVSQKILDESNFIREKLFANNKSSLSRYAELVLHSFGWFKLIKYELLITLIGPVPGAIGLLLRKFLYRGLFRQVGKGVIFGHNLTLNHAALITLGDGVVLDNHCLLDARGAGETGIMIGNRVIVNKNAVIQAKTGYIKIGDECNIGSYAHLIAQGPIILENGVSVAGKATIAGGRYVVLQENEAPEAKRRFSNGPIRIGRNTRIGMGAIIQDAVTIGENAIVAPGSVVFEDVMPNQVVWGNPARKFRDRMSTLKEKVKTQDDVAEPSKQEAKIVKQVCDYLNKDLFIEFGPGEFSPTDSLIQAHVMDSLALVRLLMWIEETFKVYLDLSELDPSDIDSVDKIVAKINEKIL